MDKDASLFWSIIVYIVGLIFVGLAIIKIGALFFSSSLKGHRLIMFGGVGLFQLLTGIGLLRGTSWGRYCINLFSISVLLFFCFSSLPYGFKSWEFWGAVYSIGIPVIYLIVFNLPSVRKILSD